MSKEISKEDIKNIRTFQADVGENEIFLTFNQDWQAEAFDDWFIREGRKAFLEWAEINSMDYED